MPDPAPPDEASLSPALVALAALVVAASPWPSDWDGVGFARAVDVFDLARWQPHAPGYPVVVLAARAVDRLARQPAWSCAAVSAVGGALVVAAVARWRGLGAWSLAALASPVLVYVCTQARSDGLGLGLASLALAVGRGEPSPSRCALAGAFASLALGARPGYAVLVATIAIAAMVAWGKSPRARAAGAGAFLGTSVLWGAWLLRAAGGFAHYREALATQAAGHFRAWGGSAWTEPDPAGRLTAAARSVALALGADGGSLGWTRVATWCGLAVVGARALGRREVAYVAALVAPYTLVAFATQNLAREPRHLLPAALALMAVAAHGLRALATTRVRRALAATLIVALAAPALETAWVGRTERPPAVALGDFIRATPRAAVFGGRSARSAAWRGAAAYEAATGGEVTVTLERLPRLPARVFVTDEVPGVRGATSVGRFCRAAPWRGGAECVGLAELPRRGR
ncbi:MAG: hypothetical protein U0324_12565 [Polyangiales bacterium]